MSDSKNQMIGKSAMLKSYTDSRFKTMKISVNMLAPLSKKTAACYGILPGIVTRATREYPNFAALNRRLSELYGASLHTGVRKLGAFQCLTVAASGISSRYAFGGDDMFAELSNLLFSALFSPLTDGDGLFPAEHFEQERRQLLELKDSEFNDKITYAHQRCEQLLFEGREAGMDRYGSREDIAGLDRRQLSAAWQELLSSSRFEIFALGDCSPKPEVFQSRFAHIGTPRPLELLPFEKPTEVRRFTEEQPLTQSKLCLAFRVDSRPDERFLFQLVSAVLGGVPSSKLFQNVREKMGLCYYCSSVYSVLSRALYVESGVETENLDRAEYEIFRQLQELQEGNLTEDELLSAKLALCNSFRSIEDSLSAVETWYLGQAFSETAITPEQAAGLIMEYTAEQVVEAAGKIMPAVVYCLKGNDNG